MDSIIILCAGSGSRACLSYNKIFHPLGESTVLDTVISRFEGLGRIILVASSVDLGQVRGLYPHLTVVEGGATRSDSVRNALVAAAGSEVVAIHDAARPFVSPGVIERAMDSARKTGSGIPAVKSIDHVCLGGADEFGLAANSFDNSDIIGFNTNSNEKNESAKNKLGLSDSINSGDNNPDCKHDANRLYENKSDNDNSDINQNAKNDENKLSGYIDKDNIDTSNTYISNSYINNFQQNTQSENKTHRNAIAAYLPKNRLFNIQTPQCFRFAEISDAYNRVLGSFADDSEVYMRAGYSPTLTDGDYKNKKLTTPADFAELAGFDNAKHLNNLENIDFSGLEKNAELKCFEKNINSDVVIEGAAAVGIGFDVHRLVEGRRLILGGVEIPYEKGLLGHSDADVLAHALSDAILSAAGKPDIGVLFPDTDPAFLGADSMNLLALANGHLLDSGKKLTYVSCVIIAQKPKLAAHIPLIRGSIAKRLGLCEDSVNISATTTEFLGIIGEGAAIAASASVLCG